MRKAVLGSWPLFLGLLLMMLGNGLQGSLLGLRASIEGFPTTITGLVMSGYYVGFLAGSTLAPAVVERVGHIRVFAALATLASSSVLLHSVFLQPATWGLLRVVTGFCYAGLYVVAESWLNDQATNETRGQLLSVYMVVMLAGMAAGQLLLNLGDPGGFKLFILISVLLSLALVPIALSTGPAPDFSAPEQLGLVRLIRISPLGVLGILGMGVAHGGLYGLGAVYAHQAGLSVPQVSVFMAVMLGGATLLQWPIGRLSDRFDRRRVITAVCFAAGLTGFVAAWAADASVYAIYAAGALIGGLSLPLYSLFVAHTNDFLTPKQMVAASAGLVLVNGLGSILGPTVAATAMDLFGPPGFFWVLGTVHVAVGLFAVYRMARRAARPLADQGAFVAMAPRAGPVAATTLAQQEVVQTEAAAKEETGEVTPAKAHVAD